MLGIGPHPATSRRTHVSSVGRSGVGTAIELPLFVPRCTPYQLVYKFGSPRNWHERRPDRSYSASVVICREGEPPGGTSARVPRSGYALV